MDLGPFLQEYVLRNPFENPTPGKPSPTSAASAVSPKIKGKEMVLFIT